MSKFYCKACGAGILDDHAVAEGFMVTGEVVCRRCLRWYEDAVVSPPPVPELIVDFEDLVEFPWLSTDDEDPGSIFHDDFVAGLPSLSPSLGDDPTVPLLEVDPRDFATTAVLELA